MQIAIAGSHITAIVDKSSSPVSTQYLTYFSTSINFQQVFCS